MDGYAGYNRLIAPECTGRDIRLAYCWAPARRKLIEITRNGSAPIAEDGVKRKYWAGLQLFLTDGRIEIDNNSVERTIRPIALNRKNALFAGHDAGAENWATVASLIETCKLNSIDPQAYLTATLTAIVNGHKQSKIGELLPWNYPTQTAGKSCR